MVAEMLANLFQSIIFMCTFYFYFEKKYSKKANYILLIAYIGIMFTFNALYTVFGDMIKMNSTLGVLLIFETYCWIALKGNIIERSIIPAVVFAINVLISTGYVVLIGLTTDYEYIEIATISGTVRIVSLIIVNLTNLIANIIFVKLRPKNIKIIKLADALAFIVMPVLTITVMYNSIYLLIDAGYGKKSVIEYGIIMACMLFTDVLVWKVMIEISKANELRTQYALMEQREELYSKNIININEQIEKTVHIKHDMKNNISCIRELIQKDSKEALNYCDKLTGELKRVYTPANTKNALLNAILNVEQEKALEKNVDMDIVILDDIMEFSKNHDIVSIVGNICDNAIEYLENNDVEPKKVSLRIERYKDRVLIRCRNSIKESVLSKNPDMVTKKPEKEFHGKGHEIVEKNVKKHDGTLEYYEEHGYFCVQIMMETQEIME